MAQLERYAPSSETPLANHHARKGRVLASLAGEPADGAQPVEAQQMLEIGRANRLIQDCTSLEAALP